MYELRDASGKPIVSGCTFDGALRARREHFPNAGTFHHDKVDNVLVIECDADGGYDVVGSIDYVPVQQPQPAAT